jgi:TolB-like protein
VFVAPIRTRFTPALLGALLGASVAFPLGAQCPDGSPPPCRASQSVASAPRRVNPPLDDRTWIVVPFDNLAKAEDVDWMRGAAVNLLYLDMSRWRDIRVVDDERVADLIREVPEANTASMSLNAGIAVAKRAGAGKLVMGDVLKLGSRTAITAKVFDVRTGQRLRSLREEAPVQDSVMPLFGKLARRILNLAPPSGAQVGALGTSRVDAYQEYVSGLEAMNRFDLRQARAKLTRAIAMDSTFALAHFKLATVIGWMDPGEPARRTHAATAARLQAGLPPRERALITGMLLQTTGDWTASCDQYEALVAKDSSDVEAWYGLGECLYHDQTVSPVPGDTTRMRFNADYDHAIRAFQKVLQLDPSYHLAYAHIVDILTAERHAAACHRPEASARCFTNYQAFLIRSGDSIIAEPAMLPRDSVALRQQAERFLATQSRRRNLQAAHDAATAWVQASPAEQRGRGDLAHIRLLQGRVLSADSLYQSLTEPSGTWIEEMRRQLDRMEIAFKLGRGVEAIRLYDSLRAAPFVIPNPQGGIRLGNAIAGYGSAFGRLAEFDSLVIANMRQQGAPPLAQLYQRHQLRAAIGAPTDSIIIVERIVFDTVFKTRGPSVATRQILGSLMLAPRLPRAPWPAIDTSLRDSRLLPARALFLKDTVALRAAARRLDSTVALLARTGTADSAFAIIAAEVHLALGDSVAALRSVRLMLDSVLPTTPLFPTNQGGNSVVVIMPRMMLLRADLAAAAGGREEARTWYRRFIDLWSTAVPELQPIVARARQALAALGGT